MFGALKRAMGAGAREVKAEYGENKDFLEAVCAAAALVAAADGDIEESERRKVVSIVQNHPTLSKLYQSNIIEQTADTMFKRAKETSGRQLLARELDDIKSRPNGSQMAEDAYLIALDIANADGDLEPAEQEVLKKLAARLGVDASKFDF
ncbi:tellurite resistance TerB family protein [Ancylobacter sp. SL191]|uniref:tellurite resistance TerB family protein n=1 Tax=Ancylobacter sp. SL191 TaxID=2995166 RepID=UPI00226D5890|nr:TerB family tellurite resistance protein [Ancylobacter sp. SL191]WAC26389.1 TerB family tellurite resistance protein [Ancylobacter sp. SL191]